MDAPSLARRMAMAWPMPEPEPVTIATLPARRPDMNVLRLVVKLFCARFLTTRFQRSLFCGFPCGLPGGFLCGGLRLRLLIRDDAGEFGFCRGALVEEPFVGVG